MRAATWPLLLAAFAVGVDGYIVAGVLPAVAADLGEPVSAVGLMASAYALPTALLAPLFGPLSDRYGRRLAMTVGLIVFSLAAMACSAAPTLALLLVARALNGLGAAIIIPAAFAYAGDLPDPEVRARTIGALASAFPLATLLGLPLGALVATLAGWRAAILVIALVAIAAAVLLRRFCPADQPRTGERLGYLATYGVVLRDRKALSVLSVAFFWFLGPSALFVFMGEFVHDAFGVPASAAGLIYMVVGLVGVAAARLAGRSIGVVGPRRMVLLGISIFAISALLLPLTRAWLPLTVADFGFWAFGTWFGLPALQSIVSGMSGTARGTMLAFNQSSQQLAGVVGPMAGGAALALGGWAAVGAAGAAFGVLALGVAWRVLRNVPLAVPAATTEAHLSLEA
ncbi:MAG: MFS transporter [Chloroflexota bacterium]